MDQYLAMIIAWGGNYAPRQFAMCNGQILPIASNTALFSLLGTYYGGNGTSNFSLPDLRGRIPVGQGDGPGLSSYVIGEAIGTENITLLSSNIPIHNHAMNGVAAVGGQDTISNAYFAEGPKKGTGPQAKSPNLYINGSAPNTPLNVQSVSVNLGGSSIPMSIMQPFNTLTYVIATQGIFPPRN